MKIIFAFLLINVFTFPTSQEDKIIGIWTVFFKDEKVTNFDCESCPKWEFKKDHTLTFTRNDKKQESTTWKIDKNGIFHFGKTLTGFQGTHPNKMANLPVKMTFSKNGQFHELRFGNNGDKAPIILRKR